MPKQDYAKGTEVIINSPKVAQLHGKRAVVRSFNPGAIDGAGKKVGIYDVMVTGLGQPSWFFPFELEVPEPASSPKTRQLLEYIADDLHRIECHSNHVDQCGYYYGSQSAERKGWVGRAERTVDHLVEHGVADIETIAKIIHAVERIR